MAGPPLCRREGGIVMERVRPSRIQPLPTKIATCAMCGGQYVRRRYNGTAHWFDCLVCGYSTPGRLVAAEALKDVRWTKVEVKRAG